MHRNRERGRKRKKRERARESAREWEKSKKSRRCSFCVPKSFSDQPNVPPPTHTHTILKHPPALLSCQGDTLSASVFDICPMPKTTAHCCSLTPKSSTFNTFVNLPNCVIDFKNIRHKKHHHHLVMKWQIYSENSYTGFHKLFYFHSREESTRLF